MTAASMLIAPRDFEASLLFSSGYAANVGLISSLAGPGDLVVPLVGAELGSTTQGVRDA